MLNTAKSFFFGLELLFYGCCNKSSQTWWLRTTEMYSLTVLEVKTPNSVSLRWKDVQHGYSSCRPSAFPLLKNVYSVLLPVFYSFSFMLSCMSCLHRLDINPSLFIPFTNIFSHSVGCLFVLLMLSFAVQKLFKFK